MNKGLILSGCLFLNFFFCFTVAPDAYPGDEMNPFGVLEFLHWDYPWSNFKYADKKDLAKTVALIKKAGIGWVRMDFIWQDIEPQDGKFQFDKYDYLVDLLKQNNLQILGLLDYSADWAASCGKWNCAPKEQGLFVRYAARVIARYKDKVKYWEVWNEPDSGTYWQPQDGLKSYCALLKEVYIAAKKANPDCKILNGGLAGEIASVNRLYDLGARDYFDILNLHFFASPLHRQAIKRVAAFTKLAYKVMQRNGDAKKKIWITEIGSPGVKMGTPTANWWLGKNPSERQQAAWLKKVFSTLLADKHVEKIFWAFFRDCKEHWHSGVDYFGLVRWDFTKKPAFYTLERFIQNYCCNK